VAGFSASIVTSFEIIWQEEFQVWRKRLLAGKRYIYLWDDGLHINILMGDDGRSAGLIINGVTPEGRKEVVTNEVGCQESILAMACKHLLQAKECWWRFNLSYLVAFVQASVKFPDDETKVLPDLLAHNSTEVVNVQEDATFI
jgi:hypothetical protein